MTSGLPFVFFFIFGAQRKRTVCFCFTSILFLAGKKHENMDFKVLPSLLDVHLYSAREILGFPEYKDLQTWIRISPHNSPYIKFSFLTHRDRPDSSSS